MVEISGTAGLNLYKNKKGESAGKITINVNEVILFGGGKMSETASLTQDAVVPETTNVSTAIQPSQEFDTLAVPKGDLPF